MSASAQRLAAFVAVAAAVIFLAAYFATPFFALDKLSRAVRARDRDQLAELVDFPKVRTNLKDQFAQTIAHRAGEHRDIEKNPLAGLVLTLVPLILDKVVDAIVTPDGVVAILQRPIGDGADHDKSRKKRWNRSWSFTGIDHFRATYSDPDDSRLVFGLVFERRGFFSWKLVQLDLPTDELSRRFGPSNDSSDESGEGVPAEPQRSGLPARVGACSVVVVKRVTTRLEDADGTEIAGSGSAIEYSDGGYQVSYDTIDGIQHSRAGDRVQLCLTELPQHCPPGDDRGRIYHALNLRTHEEWSAADSEHSCGGA